MHSRRHFLQCFAAAGLGLTGCAYWPDKTFFNPCLHDLAQTGLLQHELVARAWEGINPALYRDCHTHLIGTGDNGSGIWINPDMKSLLHPVKYLQFKFYLDAACVDDNGNNDNQYIERLLRLMHDFPAGAKAMLLAFDYHHDERGQIVTSASTFHTPNEYAARQANKHPQLFDWIASIHPYREDALEALQWAVANGARAIKWLPAAMNINPAAKQCNDFYDALVKHNIPLLTHSGEEQAVDGAQLQAYGNPLLFRQALDRGVKVIMAHCASIGSNADIDKGENGAETENIDLFARMMNEKSYEGRLFGDIAAITQVNRTQHALETVFLNEHWHHRLVQGSDYPLPGVMPLISTTSFSERGYINKGEAAALSLIRDHNPMLFDFLLKRTIRVKGRKLADAAFESARIL